MNSLVIDNFSKITHRPVWFNDLVEESEVVILIEVSAIDYGSPQLSIEGVKQRDVDEIFDTPGCFLFDVKGVHLEAIDKHPNVLSWSICRKRGAVEFSDDQIWSALMQCEAEFRPMSPLLKSSRTEFRSDDPIGYIESMSAMERILYRALGYL